IVTTRAAPRDSVGFERATADCCAGGAAGWACRGNARSEPRINNANKSERFFMEVPNPVKPRPSVAALQQSSRRGRQGTIRVDFVVPLRDVVFRRQELVA